MSPSKANRAGSLSGLQGRDDDIEGGIGDDTWDAVIGEESVGIEAVDVEPLDNDVVDPVALEEAARSTVEVAMLRAR